jgi:hypothetical protein
MAAINLAASQDNLSILSGGQASIGYSGYSTGAGHSGKVIPMLIFHFFVWELGSLAPKLPPKFQENPMLVR